MKSWIEQWICVFTFPSSIG